MYVVIVIVGTNTQFFALLILLLFGAPCEFSENKVYRIFSDIQYFVTYKT